MGEDKADELGLKPKARVHTMTMSGVDPVIMLTGPIPATEKALDRSGLSIDDIDLFEVNEAFAAVTVAWRMEHGGTDPMALWGPHQRQWWSDCPWSPAGRFRCPSDDNPAVGAGADRWPLRPTDHV